jgi:hypothetical protein
MYQTQFYSKFGTDIKRNFVVRPLLEVAAAFGTKVKILRIPDPNFCHSESRIQGQKDSRIPDPDPQKRI